LKNSKYILLFEDYHLDEGLDDRIKKLEDRLSTVKDKIKSTTERSKMSAEKAKSYNDKASKASDDISKKIYQNRTKEEKMRSQILQQDAMTIQAKAKLMQSELATAMLKKEKKDKAKG